MILQVSLISLTTSVLISLACYAFGDTGMAENGFLASLLMGTNLLVIIWTLKKIFEKKSVALAVTVIVIKYASIMCLFYFLYTLGWRIDKGFIIGLAGLFPPVGFLAYRQIKQGEMNGTL